MYCISLVKYFICVPLATYFTVIIKNSKSLDLLKCCKTQLCNILFIISAIIRTLCVVLNVNIDLSPGWNWSQCMQKTSASWQQSCQRLPLLALGMLWAMVILDKLLLTINLIHKYFN